MPTQTDRSNDRSVFLYEVRYATKRAAESAEHFSEGCSKMKKCKITVMRVACYRDLMERYENPISHACDMVEGQVFIANGWQRPEGFCESAWDSLSPFVMTLTHGGGDFYDGWMKDKRSAMISCNDGFRPVSFLLEALEEDAD